MKRRFLFGRGTAGERAFFEEEEIEKRFQKCDVLVVGSGGAALRGAIAAYETFPEGKICLITKGKLGGGSVTGTAVSDRMAFHATLPYTEPGGPDNWTYHARDIFEIGGRVSDGDLAVILAKNSGAALEYLATLGVPFARTSHGRFDQFVTDGSEFARACYTGPETAIEISKALRHKVQERPIEIFEYTMLYRLIVENNRVVGAFGLKKNRGDLPELVIFQTPAVLFGTGGAGQVFEQNVYPAGMTGDGYALSYEAGAELVNMEFQQIGLCSVKTHLACSGSMMRSMPRFVTEDGHDLLPGHLPGKSQTEIIELIFGKGANWPISAEKENTAVDLAVYREIQKGHRVFLDYSENPPGFDFNALSNEIKEKYRREIKQAATPEVRQSRPLERLREINPQAIAWLKKHGVDLEAGDRLEIAPSVQHFQGGIKIRQKGNARVRGLFAAGECAGGQHGANRPGGNALMDSQVFGKIAGEAAAEEAKSQNKNPKFDVDVRKEETELDALLGKKEGAPVSDIWKRVRQISYRFASMIRTESGLHDGLAELNELRKEPIRLDGRGLQGYFELRSILAVSEMIFRSARLRRESRGPHLYFKDEKDPWPQPAGGKEWERYAVLRKKDGKMHVEWRKPVPLTL